MHKTIFWEIRSVFGDKIIIFKLLFQEQMRLQCLSKLSNFNIYFFCRSRCWIQISIQSGKFRHRMCQKSKNIWNRETVTFRIYSICIYLVGGIANWQWMDGRMVMMWMLIVPRDYLVMLTGGDEHIRTFGLILETTKNETVSFRLRVKKMSFGAFGRTKSRWEF